MVHDFDDPGDLKLMFARVSAMAARLLGEWEELEARMATPASLVEERGALIAEAAASIVPPSALSR